MRAAPPAPPESAATNDDPPPARGEILPTVAEIDPSASLKVVIADVLAVSDQRELQLELRLQAWREGWLAGHEVGDQGGYARAIKDMERRWHEVADPVARGGPSFAELERRRWGPGGRKHFGDPRPGDYPGRGDTA